MENLVVRVKRRREEEPTDSLCIVEGGDRSKRKRAIAAKRSNNIFHSFNRLTTAEDGDVPQQLMMRRLGTIDAAASGAAGGGQVDVDEATLSHMKTREDFIPATENSSSDRPDGAHKAPPLLISRGRKRILDDDNNTELLVVDLASAETEKSKVRRTTAPSSAAAAAPGPSSPAAVAASGASPSRSPGTRVLDPVAKQADVLLQGVQSGASGASGALWAAINAIKQGQGSDANLQRSTDGLSALMLAVMNKDARAVSVLLEIGGHAMQENAQGTSALGLARTARQADVFNLELRQVLLLLQNAAANETYTTGEVGEGDDDYVFDVYVVSGTKGSGEAKGTCMDTGATAGTGTNPAVDGATLTSAPSRMETVQIPGMIFDEDGDYLFSYDSDWSDLAGDEDPDSNDERHYGNDYPDEEEEEDNLFGSDDEAEMRDKDARRYYGSDMDDDAESDGDDSYDENDGFDGSFRNRSIPQASQSKSASTGPYKAGMSIRQQFAAKFKTGHVVRPPTGDDDDDEEEKEGGMHVSGKSVSIPTYGQELSDDDNDAYMGGRTSHPAPGTVAYDPELDGEED